MCDLCEAALGHVTVEEISEGGKILILRNLKTGKVAILERDPEDKRPVKIGDVFEFYLDENGGFRARTFAGGGVN